MTATASPSAPQHHNTMQGVEKIQRDPFFTTGRGGNSRHQRINFHTHVQRPPLKECSCSPPVKHKPGSESLERVFCFEESSSSSPRSIDCNPERVFRERCLPRGKEISSSSFPLRHKTRLCAFLKNMNAAVLSISEKVFLWPGLPASRKARVQSTSARCLGFDIFSSGSPTCSFVCHTFHPRLICASLWLI